jgi:hypothetical protein
MRRFYIVLLLGISVFGTGCGRTKTYEGPDGEKATVTQKGDNVDFTITGKDGEKMQYSSNAKGVTLPDSFPKDAPIYPGATVTVHTNSPNGMMVMLKTGDSMQQAKEFYVKKLEEQGWKTENTLDMSQNTTLINKKENRTLTVTISSDKETIVQLVVLQEKE